MSPCLAAMLRGMRYWQQGWSLTKRQGKCSVLHITAEKSDPGSVGRGVVDDGLALDRIEELQTHAKRNQQTTMADQNQSWRTNRRQEVTMTKQERRKTTEYRRKEARLQKNAE